MNANQLIEAAKPNDEILAAKVAQQFVSDLNNSGIRYCIWKGSQSITDGLAGHDDLDLLVAPDEFTHLLKIANAHGFRQCESASGISDQGMAHYYSYDSDTQQFIHLHLYTRLLTGESLVQTHSLPFEEMLLDEFDQVNNLRVPSCPAELAVFILRMMIKCSSLLELAWFGDRDKQVKQKLSWLLSDRQLNDATDQPNTTGRVSSAAGTSDSDASFRSAYETLVRHEHAVSEELFFESARSLRDDYSWFQRFVIGRKIRRCLRGYERFSFVSRLALYVRLAISKVTRRTLGIRAKKQIGTEGVVLAFVGGDATGKSTLISDVERWLSPLFVTRRFHVGKPPATLVTLPVNAFLPAARMMFPALRRNGVAKPTVATKPRKTSLLQAIRAVAVAYDRNRLIKKIHRCAETGAIVICDRYPSNNAGAMDSPRIQFNASGGSLKAKLVAMLAHCEQKLYRDNPDPDVVVKLVVPIEIAKQRNQLRNKSDKHPDDELVARHESVRLWDRPEARATIELDTSASLEATKTKLRETLWRQL